MVPFNQKNLNRREALRRGLAGTAGLLLADGWNNAVAAERPSIKVKAAPEIAKSTLGSKKAKSVIQIWLWGGPSHLDTFDPKPEAGYDYCGSLNKPIKTNVDGIVISELLPLLAKQADKFSIIRGMTHGNNGHETAAYMVQTGRAPGTRDVFPCIGAVVSLFRGYDAGYRGLIPPYIVLTQPQGRFSESGFLPARYKPFATGGDPAQTKFIVEGIVAPNTTEEQQRDRRDLLEKLNTYQHAMEGDKAVAAVAESRKKAYEMILGDGAKLFDLSTEKKELRDRYGRTTFGQACLMARRLVEYGVPYVTINYSGWDNHNTIFQTMRRKLPEMDKGMATLFEDLADRKLLDSTVVWWSGEFGRTPKVQWEPPWNGGRGHYGNVFSAVVAGGGFKGGHVVGASDAKGEHVKDRPVYPCDLLGSIYELLGIDGNAKLPHPQGLDVRVMPTASDNIKRGGLLREIM